LSQTVQENLTLIVSGQPGQAPVIQINSRPYVDVEALTRLTNGSLSFKGNQITLTLPTSAANIPTATSPASETANSAFSKDFLKAGIETMAVIREWRSALLSAIQNGYPVTDDSVADYRAQAAKNLRLVYVAVSTDSDRNAYQLLSNELDKMQKFSNNIVAANQDHPVRSTEQTARHRSVLPPFRPDPQVPVRSLRDGMRSSGGGSSLVSFAQRNYS